jgi:hypothetical protein
MNNQLLEVFIKAGIIVVAAIFICVLITKRFIYFRPSSTFLELNEKYNQHYKEINHGHLNGWLFSGNSNKIILFCHDNYGNISYKQEKILAMKSMGYSILAFDYSGYGKSSGVPSEQQLYDDASAMVAMLRQTYNPEQIILYGESIGAPIATYVARRYSIPTLIIESSIPSIKEIIKNNYPVLSFFSFLFPEFDTASYLDGYKGKSLILHSTSDEIIPYESVKPLIKLCSQHILIEGSHSNPAIPWEKVNIFIEK